MISTTLRERIGVEETPPGIHSQGAIDAELEIQLVRGAPVGPGNRGEIASQRLDRLLASDRPGEIRRAERFDIRPGDRQPEEGC